MTVAILESMLRLVLQLCRKHVLALHKDRVLTIVEEEYRGEE